MIGADHGEETLDGMDHGVRAGGAAGDDDGAGIAAVVGDVRLRPRQGAFDLDDVVVEAPR